MWILLFHSNLCSELCLKRMVCICDHLPSGLIIIFTLSKSGRWWETQRGILRNDFFLVPFICLLVLFIYWLVESFLFASMDKRRETWMANYPGWLWKLGNNEKLGWQQDSLIWLGICLVDCSFRFMLSIKSFQRFRPVFNFVVHFVIGELRVCLIMI